MFVYDFNNIKIKQKYVNSSYSEEYRLKNGRKTETELFDGNAGRYIWYTKSVYACGKPISADRTGKFCIWRKQQLWR